MPLSVPDLISSVLSDRGQQHQVTLQGVLGRSHNVCVNVEIGDVDKYLRGLKSQG